jgi:hypothetical protein
LFRFKVWVRVLDDLIAELREVCSSFVDKRRGRNGRYTMADIGLSAFSVFFMQSPSFLAHQKMLEARRGRSNCASLFGMEKIPTDNHIRDMLDPVAPEALFGLFDSTLQTLEAGGGLTDFRRLGDHHLIALDGTEYHCSRKISCPNCSHRKRNDGNVEYYHQMVCGVLVAPGHERALPLAPAFITPQDGAEKQDCESRAARRWLTAQGPGLAHLKPVYLGDDLYSRQPICESVQALGADFLFVTKPASHPTLMEWLAGIALPSREQRVKKGRRFQTHRYRWLEGVPIRDGKDALLVNWLEIEIVNAAGKVTYRNSWVTSLPVGEENVAELAAAGRARWKIENESFNVLKTKGYNLEHNFGHGKENLSALLATMNLLAFAWHTLCDLTVRAWRKARQRIATRKRFFQDLAAITGYLLFPNWAALIRTMIDGQPPPEVLQAR